MKTLASLLAAVALALALAACGGGGGDDENAGGGGGGGGNGNGGVGGDVPPADDGPLAVSAAYAEGTTLEYVMRTEQGDASADGSSSTSEGRLIRLVLGKPSQIEGRTLHAVEATSFSPEHGWSRYSDFKWNHLGSSKAGILGSADGRRLASVYTDGGVSVAGLFHPFSSFEVRPKVQAADYESDLGRVPGAVSVTYGKDDGGCDVVLGQTFCDDQASSFSQAEYFKNGWGLLASRQSKALSYSGDGFDSFHRSSTIIELVATSLNAADGSKLPKRPWTTAANLPMAMSVNTAVVHDGQLWLFGSTADSSGGYTYDPNTGGLLRRSETACKNSYWGTSRAYSAGSRIVCFGMRARAEHIDPATGAATLDAAPAPGPWDPYFDVNQNYSSGTAAWTDGHGRTRLYLAISDKDSIVNGIRKLSTRIYEYNPDDATYTLSAHFTSQQQIAGAAVVGDKLYLVGPPYQAAYEVPEEEKYKSPVTECTLPGLSCARLVAEDVQYGDMDRYGFNLLRGSEHLVSVGGRLASFHKDFTSVFDPAQRQAAKAPSMLARRAEFALAVLDGRVHVVGGNTGRVRGASFLGVEVFTP